MPRESLDRGKWSQAGVPHKGWRCVRTYDRYEDSDMTEDDLPVCEMCEQVKVRFVHEMEHDDYPEIVAAGCICAGHMEADYDRAKSREAKVKNRASRRSKWISRKGWKPSGKGNPTIKVEGYQVTAFPRGALWKWSIAIIGSTKQPTFSSKSYATSHDAALGAFDAFEELTGKS